MWPLLRVASPSLRFRPARMAAAEPVCIDRQVVVKGGASKRSPWILTAMETVDGTEFVPLSMRDSGFHRFVTGSPTGLRSVKFLDRLKALRNEATRALINICQKRNIF